MNTDIKYPVYKGHFLLPVLIFLGVSTVSVSTNFSFDPKEINEQIEQDRYFSSKNAIQDRIAQIQDICSGSWQENLSAIEKGMVLLTELQEYADHPDYPQSHILDVKSKFVSKAFPIVRQYELAGQWDLVYDSFYRFLVQLYPENKDYYDKTKDLKEKLYIEKGFTETGIRDLSKFSNGEDLDVLEASLHLLDQKYIQSIDYPRMIESVFYRCEQMACVLETNSKERPFGFRKELLPRWSLNIKGLAQSHSEQFSSSDEFLRIVRSIIEINTSSIQLPNSMLIKQLTQASLSSLDSYTGIIWPEDFDRFHRTITRQYSGIGVVLEKQAESPARIADILPGSPAFDSGLRPEDIILEIDGKSTESMPIEYLAGEITGPENTPVELRALLADSQEIQQFSIYRKPIEMPSVEGWKRTSNTQWDYILDSEFRIGYLRITSFTDSTYEQVLCALKEIERQNAKALIFDLRSNPGGRLSEAVDIADLFVHDGVLLISQPRCGAATYYTAKKQNDRDAELPVTVLIDNGSASSSEVLAGILKNSKYTNNQVILIGQRTFGKGCIQNIAVLPNTNAQVKFTSMYYKLPSGVRIKNHPDKHEGFAANDWGILPDIEVNLMPHEKQMQKVAQRHRHYDFSQRPVSAESEWLRNGQSADYYDSQISAGMEVLKTLLMQNY